ncbi:MAG: septal ring lytic transglycosylase RlpA family protein [Acidobacteriota bacterium]
MTSQDETVGRLQAGRKIRSEPWRRSLPAAGLLLCVGLAAACPHPNHSTLRTGAARGPLYGMASWYGRKFHGRLTASGERYNMHQLTAAHKTLPFGTRVRVTNLENHLQVVVKINDRGPFVRGRIIDLSLAAARKIKMIGPGTVKVRLDILG